jgi:ADP-ribosylglycohydrolase
VSSSSLLPDAERFRGAILGLATGDALGATVEFQPPGSFPPVRDIVGGGFYALRPGEWTDDTSMTLALADSLIARQGFDPLDQMERYCQWWFRHRYTSREAAFGIGATVRLALEQFQFGRDREPFGGSTDPLKASNGCIMRLAPVALAFVRQPALALDCCVQSSRTTHGAPQCLDACWYFGGLLVGALQGTPREQLLSANYCPLPAAAPRRELGPEIAEVAAGSFERRQPPEIKGTGHVVRSLEAALWAFRHSTTFEEGALLAVNLGDDADTTGAVYGQLAGAHYGESGIPLRWRGLLAHHDLLVTVADRLFTLSQTLA